MRKTKGDLNIEEITNFFNKYSWRWAKTYENFAPHEYLMIFDVVEDEKHYFPKIAQYIQENGYKLKFGSRIYKCIDVGEYRYWTMERDTNKTKLINRTKNKGYEGYPIPKVTKIER